MKPTPTVKSTVDTWHYYCILGQLQDELTLKFLRVVKEAPKSAFFSTSHCGAEAYKSGMEERWGISRLFGDTTDVPFKKTTTGHHLRKWVPTRRITGQPR
jgi:hypothetical protein